MATSRVTPDADEIVSEIQIAAPPERVFQALVDPKQVVKWWGQTGVYVCREFECDLRAGGKWRSAGVGSGGREFEVKGECVEVKPPKLLVLTWMASWTGDVKTTVRWELEATKQGALLRLRHSGMTAQPDLAKSYTGWPRLMGWLQAFLEKGETIGDRKAGA